VLEAGDGRQALTQLDKAGKVNLIVSDVNMPNMDGITFVAEVKKHARHKFVPVIMLTTEDEAAKMQQAKAAGARAWLLKPFDPPAAAGRGVRSCCPDEPPCPWKDPCPCPTPRCACPPS
jgi:two-component system chemotaxis response regulator CheY